MYPAPKLLALAAILSCGGAWAQTSAPLATEPLLLPESALPAYERELDHAGLIRSWDKASLARGEKVYQAVCHGCHGDANLRGSLPDALTFAHGAFKRRGDPLGMYETITRGWRLMPPQVQLVPREKYDVIHYIREVFLAQNPHGAFAVTDDYLAGLPPGRSRGPAPSDRQPWREMDYGSMLTGTFEMADPADRAAAAARRRTELDLVPAGANIAYKGIAIQLDAGAGGVAAGKAWVVFEHDTLRVAGGWTGEGFIDWEGINFNGRHVVWPRTAGEVHFETADGPGWANPATGRFDEARVRGLDGRHFGPFPREWLRYRGLYRHGQHVVVSYDVGGTAVLESHAVEWLEGVPVFVRTLNVAASQQDLRVRLANAGATVGLRGGERDWLSTEDGFVTLSIPAASTPVRLAVTIAASVAVGVDDRPMSERAPRDLTPWTQGGPAQWVDPIFTPVVESDATGPFAWARLTLPLSNPWRARLRPSGLDFLPDGRAAVVCTWDGDVWRVDGIEPGSPALRWRRIAAGLFQPLGIRIRGGEIFVACRDQIVRLRDLNGDGEADHYENFNSDHQVTEHFHEFAMGLQTDATGNFYYAKSARHARTPLVPHHGTLLKVSADGATTEILANGFRAANGVCVNEDGTFYVTDQEGNWMPMNRINRVERGRFYGNMWSYGAPADESDAAMEPPVCWIDKAFDRSPGELVRVEGPGWGTMDGTLLNLSYGRGRMEIVLQERAGDRWQGAVCALPIPDFPTGVMRGRIHPVTGELYVCGLSAWGSSQMLQEGGVYRLRRTRAPAWVPTAWHVTAGGVELTFSDPLPRTGDGRTMDADVKAWGLKRSANYGSARIAEMTWPVTSVEVAEDRRRLRLRVPALRPTDIIEITCRFMTDDGQQVTRVLTGTVHHLAGGN